MRPQEFSARFTRCNTILFFMFWSACVRECRTLECVGVIIGTSFLLDLTCDEQWISHTHYITTPLAELFVTNTWRYNVTPTLTFQGCVIILL